MTRKLQPGLMFILLVLGISCTKENNNSPNRSSAQANDESESVDALAPGGVKGTWNFYYDWGCTGFPPVSTLKIKKDGTFSTGFSEKGQWISGDGLLVFHYDGYNTCYAGRTRHGQVDGIQAGFVVPNSTGCFNLTQILFAGEAFANNMGQNYPSGKKYIEPPGFIQSSLLPLPENVIRYSGDETSDFGVAITGSWTLNFDWGCAGFPFATSFIVNGDGTWVDGQANTGQWIVGDGIFLFKYDGLNTCYAGRTRNGQIDGISGAFDALNQQGCFHMTKVAFTGTETHIKGQPYATGAK